MSLSVGDCNQEKIEHGKGSQNELERILKSKEVLLENTLKIIT